MNRKLKFRGWGHFGSDKTDKMIYNWEESVFPEYIGIDGSGYFEVMQFTGETDKNGKEIYEGDILRSSAELDKPRIAQVIFKDAQFRVIYPPHDFDSPLSFFVRLMEPKQAEIIGNIYENPELLNHAKA